MAKITRTIGTGITAESRTSYSGEDMLELAVAFSNNFNALLEKGGGQFGAITYDAVKFCEADLQNAGDPPFERDSREWFSQLILQHYKIVKKAIESGDADDAARSAYQMGYLHCKAHMKGRWEPYALSGQERAQSLRDARERANKEREQIRRAEWALWNEEAERIWAKYPKLSKSRVAELIRQRLEIPDKIDTISRRLQKVRKAG